MSLFNTLKVISGHPLNRGRRVRSLVDFIKWQVGSRLVPGQVLYDWVNGTRVIVRPGETGFTGNIYCGLHEFPDMAYVLHVLDAEDLFVDIGANVGSYTILACGARGARGCSFEPVPATYRRLMDNIRVNNLSGRVDVRNIGLSDQAGELSFTSGENCTNHVLATGENPGDVVTVRVLPLDAALEGKLPAVLKIDVEGFELRVLDGARVTLRNPALHSVIMELNGSGERYGFRDEDVLEKMKTYGFLTYDYDPFPRTLKPLDGKNSRSGNTLFIRDLEAVNQRIQRAPRIAIGSTTL